MHQRTALGGSVKKTGIEKSAQLVQNGKQQACNMKAVLFLITGQDRHLPEQLIDPGLGDYGAVVDIVQPQGTVKEGTKQSPFRVNAVHDAGIKVEGETEIGLLANEIRAVGFTGAHEKDLSVFKFVAGAFGDIVAVSTEDAEDLAVFVGVHDSGGKGGIYGGLTVGYKMVAAVGMEVLGHGDHLPAFVDFSITQDETICNLKMGFCAIELQSVLL